MENNLKITYCKMFENNLELNKGLLPQERKKQMVMSKNRIKQSIGPFDRLKTKQTGLSISH